MENTSKIETEHKEMSHVLKMIQQNISGLSAHSQASVEVIYEYDGNFPEDSNPFFAVSKLLKEEGAVQGYQIHKRVKKSEVPEMDIERIYSGRWIKYFKITYSLVPAVLLEYMKNKSFLPKYTLSMNRQGNLILNDRHVLHTVRTNGPNFYFFKHALRYPGTKITNELVSQTAGSFNKRFQDVLEQTIKILEFKKAFFPIRKKDGYVFRPAVTVQNLRMEKINEKKIVQYLKKRGFKPEKR